MRLNDATPDMWDKATQKYGKVAEKTGLEPWATWQRKKQWKT